MQIRSPLPNFTLIAVIAERVESERAANISKSVKFENSAWSSGITRDAPIQLKFGMQEHALNEWVGGEHGARPLVFVFSALCSRRICCRRFCPSVRLSQADTRYDSPGTLVL